MKVIRIYILICISLLIAEGCRDYISNFEINQQPVITTDAIAYGVNDTIRVTLTNNSLHTIYIKQIYSVIEIKDQNNWDTYSASSCGGCLESSLQHNHSLFYSGKLVQNPGTYRLVCLYSMTPGLADQDKIKLYSNSFTVR